MPSRDSLLIHEGGATQGSGVPLYPSAEAHSVHVLFFREMLYKRKKSRSEKGNKRGQGAGEWTDGKGREATHDCQLSSGLLSI